MNRREWLAATTGALAACHLPVWAQNRPTRLLVGAPPGGGTDLVARGLAVAMEKPLASTVVVENRPGAAGNIAASAVAAARGNPSTLLLAYTSHAINASLMQLPFDPLTDFTPISLVATSPLLLVANTRLPVDDLPGLLAYARRENREISIGIPGLGSAGQLVSAMLQHQTGMPSVSVPYKGAAPAMQDLLGGQIDLMVSNLATARAFLAAGQIKPLAISTRDRAAEYPEVASVADVVPGFDFSSWYGLLGPADMPAPALAQLETAARESAASERLRQQLSHEGLRPVGSDRAAFEDFLRSETDRFAQVVRLTGLKMG